LPIRDPNGANEYKPTETEARIIEHLRKSGELGLPYSRIIELTGLSDTALSKYLSRMQHYNLILRDEKRRYHTTVLGLMFLMSLKPAQYSKDELKSQRKRDIDRLWAEARRLQEKVLRILWLPYADETSKLLFGASGGSPDLIYIGALKTKDGKAVLSFKTPGMDELQKLGYT